MSTFFATYPVLNNSGGSSGVTSLNGQAGNLTLVAGTNVTITPGSGTLTIASTGSGGQTVTNFVYTLTPTDITNGFAVMSSTPTAPTLALLTVVGGPMQLYGNDYVVSGNHVSWGSQSLQGVLVSGDVIIMESY